MAKRRLAIVNLGHRDYQSTWDLQRRLVEARQAGAIGDIMLAVEHPPTYTVGRQGNFANILLNDEQLQQRGIKVFHIDRGGDVTYHGPGQLVGYPIIHLGQLGIGVREYIHRLETGLIDACAQLGVEAVTEPGLVGVWTKGQKIAAIGVRFSRYVTSHGFALNVTTDLKYFDWIIPCGIAQRGVTSLERELGKPPAWDQVYQVVTRSVANALGYEDWSYHDGVKALASFSGQKPD